MTERKLKIHNKIIKFISSLIPLPKARRKFRARYMLLDITNRVFLVDDDGAKTRLTRSLPGLTLDLNGKNHIIEISKNAAFENCRIATEKFDNAVIKLGSGEYNNLFVSILRGNDQSLKIGENFRCYKADIYLSGDSASVGIGDDCLFSSYIDIRAGDAHSLINCDNDRAFNMPEPVKIGNHVWVGAHVCMTKGTKISDNSVIGLGSVVTSRFSEPNVVIAGNPAKIIKSGVNWNYEEPHIYNKNRPE